MLIVRQAHVCVFGRGVNPAGYNRPITEYQPVTEKPVWYPVGNNR
jgi:hypothetical protein